MTKRNRAEPSGIGVAVVRMLDTGINRLIEGSATTIEAVFEFSDELKEKYLNDLNKCVSEELRRLSNEDNLVANLLENLSQERDIPGKESFDCMRNCLTGSFDDFLHNTVFISEVVSSNIARERALTLIDSYADRNYPIENNDPPQPRPRSPLGIPTVNAPVPTRG